MTLNVDSIATDAEVGVEMGGQSELVSAQKNLAVRDAFRASALGDVLSSLTSRTPPVYEWMLTNPLEELKKPVIYRTLQKICSRAMTDGRGDRYDTLSIGFGKDYEASMRASFTIAEGQKSPGSRTVRLGRR